jgi:hypothetical protein
MGKRGGGVRRTPNVTVIRIWNRRIRITQVIDKVIRCRSPIRRIINLSPSTPLKNGGTYRREKGFIIEIAVPRRVCPQLVVPRIIHVNACTRTRPRRRRGGGGGDDGGGDGGGCEGG